MSTPPSGPQAAPKSALTGSDEQSQALSRRSILVLAGGTFLGMATARISDAMLPELARAFSASLAEVAPVISLFAFTYGVMQLVYGGLGDRYGKLLIVTIATFVSCLSALAAALSGSLDQLIWARVLSGASTAAIIPLMLAWIGDVVPYAQRQATLAKLAAGTAVGLVGGQLAGGLISDTLGWRWAFALLALLGLLVGWLLVTEFRPHLKLIPASARLPNQSGFFRRVLNILNRPLARLILLTAFCDGLLIFGVLAIIPAYLHGVHGMSLTAAGFTLALFGVGGLIYSLIAGSMIKMLGELRLARLGGIACGGAYVLLGFIPSGLFAVPLTLLAGFGFYMLHNTLQTNATQMAPEARGMGVAMFASVLFIGQAIGVSLAAALLVGLGGRTPLITGGAVLMFVGLAFAWMLQRIRSHARP